MRDVGPRCAAYAAAYRQAWATARKRHYPGPAVARYASLHAARTVHATCTAACLTPTPMKEHTMPAAALTALARATWAQHGKPAAPFAFYGLDAAAWPQGERVATVTVERRTVRLFDMHGHDLAYFNIAAKVWLGPADAADVRDCPLDAATAPEQPEGFDPEVYFDATVGGRNADADGAADEAAAAADELVAEAVEMLAEPTPVDAFVADLQAADSDADLLAAYDGYLQRATGTVAAVNGARYQVRGPHSGARDATRWTVVDTHDSDTAVDTHRRKQDAQAAARELNGVGAPAAAPNVLRQAATAATLRSVRVGRRAQAALAAQQGNPLAAEVLAAMEGAKVRASGACSVRVSPAAAELVRSLSSTR